MKYFLDTEFMEGVQERPLILKSRLGHWMIGKPKPTIDLISIGIVAEDGREYYAISKDFNLEEAWNRFDIKQEKYVDSKLKAKAPELYSHSTRNIKVYWLRENVLYPIFWYLYQQSQPIKASQEYGNLGNFMGWKERKGTGMKEFKKLLQKYGKTNKEIAEEVFEFCTEDSLSIETAKFYKVKHPEIEFYAYYADYDWVVFCWLFGKMMDLPDGFPMYCKDLKQMLDEKAESFIGTDLTKFNINLNEFEAVKNGNFSSYVDAIKNHSKYPKQENEHSAIDDARWNKKLYEFLKQL